MPLDKIMAFITDMKNVKDYFTASVQNKKN